MHSTPLRPSYAAEVRLTAAQIAAGAAIPLDAVRIVVVDGAGVPTGDVYESGPAGSAPTAASGPSAQASQSVPTSIVGTGAIALTQAGHAGRGWHAEPGQTSLTLAAADWPDGGELTVINHSGEALPVVLGAGWTAGYVNAAGGASLAAGELASLKPLERAIVQAKDGAFVNVAILAGSQPEKGWAASTDYLSGDIVRAPSIQGAIGAGDRIIRTNKGKSRPNFDATEAAFWVELVEDPDFLAHQGNTSNPHGVTKAQVGLGSVDNTSDVNKPVSTAQATAIGAKAALATTGTPVMDGVAALGSAVTAAKSDHVHPSDTSRAADAVVVKLAGAQTVADVKTFTSSPVVPTPTSGDNTTKAASTAFVKAAVDGAVAGLLDYRGAFTPAVSSGASGYPTTGGSGTSGAIAKGDAFVASAGGFVLTEAIQAGDMIIAKADAPGQTGTSWDRLNANVAYVPEDQANKVTAFASPTDTQYPSAKLVSDQLALKQAALASGSSIRTVNGSSLLGAGDVAIAADLPGGVATTILDEGLVTTGSPTIDRATVPGQTILRWTGAGTFTPPLGVVAARVLLLGGGGGGGGWSAPGGTATQGGGAGGPVAGPGVAGAANTGGGGGGSNAAGTRTGGAGGSGVVIVRFATQSRSYQALGSYASDSAAAAGNVLVGQFYRDSTTGAVRQRA